MFDVLRTCAPEDLMNLATTRSRLTGERLEDALLGLCYDFIQSKGNHSISIRYKTASYHFPVLGGHLWNGRPGRSDIVIIGKNPGSTEMAFGCNFVGPSGEVLREALKELGFTDDQFKSIYVTNVIKWYPKSIPNNAFPANWMEVGRFILALELIQIKPKIILLLGTDAVKAVLGSKYTLKGCLHKELRRKITDTHEARVFVATHPAAIARNRELFKLFVSELADFAGAVLNRQFPTRNSQIKIDVISRAEDLQKLVNEIKQTPGLIKLAVDLEWEGQFPVNKGAYVRTIQLSHRPDYAAVILLHDVDGKPCFQPSVEAATELLKEIFSLPNLQIGGANIAADYPWLKSLGIDILEPRGTIPEDATGPDYPGIFDVALAEHSYNENARYDLESLAVSRCGFKPWSEELEKWKRKRCNELNITEKQLSGYGACPDHILIPYAATDAAATRSLMDVYSAVLETGDPATGNDVFQVFKVSMKGLAAVMHMHDVGVKVNKNQIDKLTLSYMEVLHERLEEFRAKINWPDFNPRSYYHVTEFLFGDALTRKVDAEGRRIRVRPTGALTLNLTPIKTTNKKSWSGSPIENPSTDKEVCGILALQHPLAGELRDIKFIDHVLKSVLRLPKRDGDKFITDEDGNLDYDEGIASFICDDGRIHGMFSILAETGRLRSSRPNLQNMAKSRESAYEAIAKDKYPGPIRSIFTAEPGYLLVEADFKVAEVFCLAVMSQDPLLLEHCMRATLPESDPNYYDIHSNVAVNAFHLDCAPTKKALAAIGKAHLRVGAKAVLFGGMYGRGADAIARQCQQEGVHLTVEDAEKIMNAIFSTYKDAAHYLETLEARVDSPGWIRTYFGRIRHFFPSADPAEQGHQRRQARNFVMQSTVADAMNLTLYALYCNQARKQLGYRIVLQMHDAFLLEVPEKYVDVVAKEIIPRCVESVRFRPCTPDGEPYGSYYHFCPEVEVYEQWGVPLKR